MACVSKEYEIKIGKTLEIKDENFNMGVHWKIQFLEGVCEKQSRELSKKGNLDSLQI